MRKTTRKTTGGTTAKALTKGRTSGPKKAAKKTTKATKTPKTATTKKAAKATRAGRASATKDSASATKVRSARKTVSTGKATVTAKGAAAKTKAPAATTTKAGARKKASAKKPATPRKSAKTAVTPRRKPEVIKRRPRIGPDMSPKPPAPPPPAEMDPREARKLVESVPYEEGSFVVHPKYGLGKVERIQDRTLTLRRVPCLEIYFSHQDMKLTIPIDQLDRSGLRRPIGKKEITNVFTVLKGRATFDAKRRSARRVADYQRRVRQGDPVSLAEVVRDLSRLSLKKALSYEERKILSDALRILSREVALARGREIDDVLREIELIVNR